MIVEWSRERMSKRRREPSAPTETNVSEDFGEKLTSNTSLSCAISCVLILPAFWKIKVVLKEVYGLLECPRQYK